MSLMIIGAGIGLAALLCVAGALAGRHHIRRGLIPGGPQVRAVPHAGPPPLVTLRETGTEPALAIHLAPQPGVTSVTTGPVWS